MVVRSETCIFSGRKMYPGHGKYYVPSTNVNSTRPIFHLESKKARRLFERRIRPKQVAWTQLYRKLHKKDLRKKEKEKDYYPKKVKCDSGLSYMTLAELKAKKQECMKEREKKKKKVGDKRIKKKKVTKDQKRAKRDRKKQKGGGQKLVMKKAPKDKRR